jgi:hypothetical protein
VGARSHLLFGELEGVGRVRERLLHVADARRNTLVLGLPECGVVLRAGHRLARIAQLPHHALHLALLAWALGRRGVARVLQQHLLHLVLPAQGDQIRLDSTRLDSTRLNSTRFD